MTKVCSKCGIEKDVSEFYFRKDKGYYKNQCKNCCLAMDKEYRNINKDKIFKRVKAHIAKPEIKKQLKEYRKKYKQANKEIISIKNKKYREEHMEHIKEWHKNHYAANKNTISIKSKIYRDKNKEKKKEYCRKWRKKKLNNDSEYKVKSYMISHFTRELKKKNIDKKESMFRITGIKYSEYVEYLKNDPLWNDYHNKTKKISVDHIIPISVYDFTDQEEIRKCWNKLNLRLLPSDENLKKLNKIDIDLIKKHNIGHLLPKGLKI